MQRCPASGTSLAHVPPSEHDAPCARQACPLFSGVGPASAAQPGGVGAAGGTRLLVWTVTARFSHPPSKRPMLYVDELAPQPALGYERKGVVCPENPTHEPGDVSVHLHVQPRPSAAATTTSSGEPYPFAHPGLLFGSSDVSTHPSGTATHFALPGHAPGGTTASSGTKRSMVAPPSSVTSSGSRSSIPMIPAQANANVVNAATPRAASMRRRVGSGGRFESTPLTPSRIHQGTPDGSGPNDRATPAGFPREGEQPVKRLARWRRRA